MNMSKHLKRPRDPSQLGKLIVDISVGEIEDQAAPSPPKNEAAAELGRKGGKARAANLSSKERRRIATDAANARWRKSN
jgi:hypothetical protein